MRPGNERAPASTGAPTSVTKPAKNHSNRLTHTERVLRWLLENEEVCGSQLYADFLPRFGHAIFKLRRSGYVISRRLCTLHQHEGQGWLYRLEALPDEPVGRRCLVCDGILDSDAPHVSTCPVRRFDGEQTLFGGA